MLAPILGPKSKQSQDRFRKRAPQESPKTAKKPPKTALDSLKEPLTQIVQFQIKLGKSNLQHVPGRCPNIVRKLVRKIPPKVIRQLHHHGGSRWPRVAQDSPNIVQKRPKIAPRWPMIGGPNLPKLAKVSPI